MPFRFSNTLPRGFVIPSAGAAPPQPKVAAPPVDPNEEKIHSIDDDEEKVPLVKASTGTVVFEPSFRGIGGLGNGRWDC